MLKLAQDVGENQYKNTTFFKALLKKHGVSYQELSRRLETIGVKRSPTAIRQALHRGSLSMAFLLQAMEVLQSQPLNVISSLKTYLKHRGFTYKDLSRHLTCVGIHYSPFAIANILSRGDLSPEFLKGCKVALNVKKHEIDHLALAL